MAGGRETLRARAAEFIHCPYFFLTRSKGVEQNSLQLVMLQSSNLCPLGQFPGFPRSLRRFPSISERCCPVPESTSAWLVIRKERDVPWEGSLLGKDDDLVLMRDVTLDEALSVRREESTRLQRTSRKAETHLVDHVGEHAFHLLAVNLDPGSLRVVALECVD